MRRTFEAREQPIIIASPCEDPNRLNSPMNNDIFYMSASDLETLQMKEKNLFVNFVDRCFAYLTVHMVHNRNVHNW
jgi:hypothetical protein